MFIKRCRNLYGIGSIGLVLSGISFAQISPPVSPALVIHEFSTVTTLHLPLGQAEGGLNARNTEGLLPDFIHHLDSQTSYFQTFSKAKLRKPTVIKSAAPPVTTLPDTSVTAASGTAVTPAPIPAPVAPTPPASPIVLAAAPPHPDIKMRLETSLMYFYPTSKWNPQQLVDVEMIFRGGLFNEYYPEAEVLTENIFPDQTGIIRLLNNSNSKITWKALQLGGNWPGPDTKDPMWLASRITRSANILSLKGESEKYLFYRGVSNNVALLTTKHDPISKSISISNNALINGIPIVIPASWVISIKENGNATYRALGPLKEGQKVTIPESFSEESYDAEKLHVFRKSLRYELIRLGLYSDEAEAALNTWDKSFFSKGVRIFYLIPREWINYYLPQRFSIPVESIRVMVGRIDLLGL